MWNLADYETVEDRLAKFWKDNEGGRIQTELLEHSSSRFIVLASIYKSSSDSSPWATGLAEETVGTRGVNQTSALENCETSAIGRALANAGYAAKGKRASREEMGKVVRLKGETINVENPNDPWTTQEKPMPITGEQAVETIKAVMGDIEETPTCAHGQRKLREGVKNNKPYRGWVCTSWEDLKCEPMWMHLSKSTGKWVFND